MEILDTEGETKPAIDPGKLTALGARLSSKFEQYEKDRRIAELQWMRNLRQFLGVYDPEVKIPEGFSKAYPRLTRVKCVSMVSRLMSMLFPNSERNWGVAPSPVPNLPQNVLQKVLTQAQADAEKRLSEGQEFSLTDLVNTAIWVEAETRAERLERVIADQLSELGGSHSADYVSLVRKVLMSGVLYGVGVLTGPFVYSREQQRWTYVNGQLVAVVDEVQRPRFEFVNHWDYYPDMSAKTWEQMDGQFQRHVMSRSQLQELAKRDDFDAEAIKQYLKDHPSGNYMRRTYESELKALGVQSNVNDQGGSKYEAIQWEGFLSREELAGIFDLPEGVESVPVSAWFVGNTLIKYEVNAWYTLSGEHIAMYHRFVFEEDDTSLFGNALPNIMRDSQMSVCLAARMSLDNAAIASGPQVELDVGKLMPGQDLTKMSAYKTWYRDETAVQDGIPAVRELKFESHIVELRNLMQSFMQFADLETFVSPANGGDQPAEPMRTAAGASMIRSDAALPFKDVVRNFDRFTESVITSIIKFNEILNDDTTIKGDFQTVARGSTSLVAKEMRSVQIDQYIQTLRPEEMRYVKWYDLSIERAAVRDLPVAQVLMSRAEAKMADEQAAQQASQQAQVQEQLLEASIRKILADSLKAASQADKNTANAANQTLDTLVTGMQAGIPPESIVGRPPQEQIEGAVG